MQISVTYEEYPDIFNGDYLPDAYELLFEEPEGDYIRLLTNKKNNENVMGTERKTISYYGVKVIAVKLW